MKDLRVSIIGWGSMGEAIIPGLLRLGIPPRNIAATGTRKERGQELKRAYPGLRISTENAAVLNRTNVLILAVKPQVAACVMAGLKGKLAKGTLVMSIMAGIPIRQLQEGLASKNVVRCMPNTPAKIGIGFTGWTAAAEVSPGDRAIVKSILEALGVEMHFSKEDLLHAVTAASATAVAIVCEFVEAVTEGALYTGMPKHDARRMVIQTIKGTLALMERSGQHPAVLRDEVTSPAGTTTRALRAMEEGCFAFTVLEAIRAAYDRSVELGRN